MNDYTINPDVPTDDLRQALESARAYALSLDMDAEPEDVIDAQRTVKALADEIARRGA